MNYLAAAIAMAPEHLLLAGIVVLLILEIASERSRAADRKSTRLNSSHT